MNRVSWLTSMEVIKTAKASFFSITVKWLHLIFISFQVFFHCFVSVIHRVIAMSIQIAFLSAAQLGKVQVFAHKQQLPTKSQNEDKEVHTFNVNNQRVHKAVVNCVLLLFCPTFKYCGYVYGHILLLNMSLFVSDDLLWVCLCLWVDVHCSHCGGINHVKGMAGLGWDK